MQQDFFDVIEAGEQGQEAMQQAQFKRSGQFLDRYLDQKKNLGNVPYDQVIDAMKKSAPYFSGRGQDDPSGFPSDIDPDLKLTLEAAGVEPSSYMGQGAYKTVFGKPNDPTRVLAIMDLNNDQDVANFRKESNRLMNDAMTEAPDAPRFHGSEIVPTSTNRTFSGGKAMNRGYGVFELDKLEMPGDVDVENSALEGSSRRELKAKQVLLDQMEKTGLELTDTHSGNLKYDYRTGDMNIVDLGGGVDFNPNNISPMDTKTEQFKRDMAGNPQDTFNTNKENKIMELLYEKSVEDADTFRDLLNQYPQGSPKRAEIRSMGQDFAMQLGVKPGGQDYQLASVTGPKGESAERFESDREFELNKDGDLARLKNEQRLAKKNQRDFRGLLGATETQAARRFPIPVPQGPPQKFEGIDYGMNPMFNRGTLRDGLKGTFSVGAADFIPSPEVVRNLYAGEYGRATRNQVRDIAAGLPVAAGAGLASMAVPAVSAVMPGVGAGLVTTAVADAANEVSRQQTGENLLPKFRRLAGTKPEYAPRETSKKRFVPKLEGVTMQKPEEKNVFQKGVDFLRRRLQGTK